MTSRAGVVCLALFAVGCIKVPGQVKLAFCAQSSSQNHFGSGAAAGSCCPGPPKAYRFGAEERSCRR